MKKKFKEYYSVKKNISEIEIYTLPINGIELLNEIKETIQKYIVADDEVIIAVTLWCVFTWYIDEVFYAPIVNITSPEKESGKSKLLNILQRLSFKPQLICSTSKAALFRTISEYQYTLLFDDLNNSFLKNRDVISIFVNGFTKDNRLIVRCNGELNTPRPYETWGAKAICSTGIISEQLSSVSISLPLKRKLRTEDVKDVISSDPKIWEELKQKIARFVADTKDQLNNIDVPKLEELSDRANDCWQSLFKIALVAGDHWFNMAKKAAILLTDVDKGAKSYQVELLTTIKDIFVVYKDSKISSKELCDLLNNHQQANIKIWNNGKEIEPIYLAYILKKFGIKPKVMRIGENKTKRGYELKQFTDIFNRYLQEK